MPKIYALCGVVGFALSFLIGLFSGASFLIVLVRALVFGAVFVGLAVLFNFLLKRFVPDLFDKNAAAAAPKPKTTGTKLDITISDEGDAPPEEDDFTVPDFVKNRSKGGAASASGGAKQDVPKESVSASESEQSADAPAEAEDDAPASASESDADADFNAMPDTSEFADDDDEEEFGSDGLEDTAAPLNDAPISAGVKSPNRPVSDADAETMAKAIRTVLAEDKDE